MAESESGNPTVPGAGRAHEQPCHVLHPTLPLHIATQTLDQILQEHARRAEGRPSEAPGFTLVDCSSLIPGASQPVLYTMWITRASTPSLFSLTCVCEHLRNQLVENGKVVMSIFNDTGGYGEAGEALAAGTYMVVLKRVDVERLRCVPVSLSSLEKKVVKEYMVHCQSSSSSD
ncbi:uncharacterized protein CC84DRAFT_1176743 [Paraphaeosphaeria sporulosa]|uniref:Uncharacterized protein n=1 Tax=Paraphaeosphaeria sporulosa TaxID=1460663 RepID=A0A177CB37_9PLEO|nr:uncharacterized protein CC84DRAFT_1176743 [Paraphaeosphaeria sporulosa]OAG04536.1 hypothetical protein CC84DRAFT_1176743 [Paraphaeosphaeria sporulosa]